jgi:hypothetical protein
LPFIEFNNWGLFILRNGLPNNPKHNASKIVDTPNYLTVQISETKHIHLSPEYLQYVNHCCEPNVLFNTTTMQLECISDIEAGEELRF